MFAVCRVQHFGRTVALEETSGGSSSGEQESARKLQIYIFLGLKFFWGVGRYATRKVRMPLRTTTTNVYSQFNHNLMCWLTIFTSHITFILLFSVGIISFREGSVWTRQQLRVMTNGASELLTLMWNIKTSSQCLMSTPLGRPTETHRETSVFSNSVCVCVYLWMCVSLCSPNLPGSLALCGTWSDACWEPEAWRY